MKQPSVRRLFALGALAVIAGGTGAASLHAAPPSHKQWRLVFSDEFDGAALDESRWTRRDQGTAFAWNGAKGRIDADHADVDGDGNFVIRISRDADGTYCYHHGVNTRGKHEQTYGYFETRARFSREPGWWGAVWLYGVDVGPNPFLLGQEIDLFEDFYKPKAKNDFAHNVHFDAQLESAREDNKKVGKLDGDTLYRVSRGTNVLVDDWDAFHVIGVEWTPLEYIFYCDGKETFRLDYRQVPVTNQPMHILISGCFRDPGRAGWQGDYADGKWPDQLTVDYVRAYQEDPGARRGPEVTLRLAKPGCVVSQDDEVVFNVTAGDADGSVTDLYLFANGRIRAEKASASATFAIRADRLYYGRNVLIALARDNDGLVGASEPLSLTVRGPGEGKGRPYLGRPQVIPGRIVPGHYDEGGRRVANFSHLKDNQFAKPPWDREFRQTEGIDAVDANGIAASHYGLWVTYTVQIRETGDYEVTPWVARPDSMVGRADREDHVFIEFDGEPLADFAFSSRLSTGVQHWRDYRSLPSKVVHLEEGTGVLTIRFDAMPFHFGGLSFARAVPKPRIDP